MRTQIICLTAVISIGFMGIGLSYAQEAVNLLPNGGFENGSIASFGTYGNVTSEVVTECVDAAVSERPIEGD